MFGNKNKNNFLTKVYNHQMFTPITLIAIAIAIPFTFMAVFAAATVTAATGGSAISADNTGGSWTTLTGPTLAEGAHRDISTTGTIILNAPTGFEFNTGQNVTATITLLVGSKNCFTFSSGTATPTSSTITFTVSAVDQAGGSPTTYCKVDFSNIQVRPTAGTPLASGNITKSGTATIAGVTGSTNFGTLTEVAGTATKLGITTQPSGTASTNTDFATKPVVAVQDQYGNTKTTDNTSTITRSAVLSTQVCGGTAGSGAITSTPANATAVTSGVMTYTAMQYSAGESIKICFTSGVLTSALSNTIVVSAPPPTVSSVTTAHADGTFKSGEVIDITVTYSEVVNVNTGGGTPTLALNSGGSASYNSGSGSATLTFRYTVAGGQTSADLDYNATTSLALNGGTIKNGGGTDADNTLPAVGTFAAAHAIVIDTTAPSLSFSDNVAAGPVASDTITPGWGDASVKKWDYDADGVCSVNAGDYTKTDANSMDQSTEANNGKWICMYGEDAVGNKSTLASANDINIDATGPSLSFSDNVAAGPVASDTITPGWGDASVKKWDYDADGVCSVNAGDYTKTDANSMDQSTEANNGKYICMYGEDAVGNKSTLASANDINIDITPPSLSFSDNVAAGPVTSDTITGSWGDASVKKWDYDADGVCSVNAGDYTKTDANSMDQSTEANNGKYICMYGEDALGNKSTLASANDINIDTTAPTVTEVTPVPDPTTDTTPDYTFNTDEAGTITYGGDCSSATTTTASGNKTVTFNSLAPGLHSNCTVRVTDSAGNQSNLLDVTDFTVNFTGPVFTSVAPITNAKVNNTKVSYTLNKAIVSGNVKWARTGGSADGDHDQALAGSELNSGAHTDITLTNDPTLVSGAIYTITWNGTDGVDPAATVTSTNVTYDTTSPTVSSVNTAHGDGSFTAGEVIDITVTYDENVIVNTGGGTPTLALNSGGTASYNGGSGTSTLTFRHTVAGGQNSADLDYSTTGSLSANGGTIKDAAGNDADNTLPAVGTFAGAHAIVIDSTGPTLSFSDNVEAGPVASDTITPGWGDATVKKWDYDADGVCSTNAGDYTKTDANTMNQTDGTNNTNWICMYGEDALGNKSTLASANDINVDTTGPTLSFSDNVEAGPVASDTVTGDWGDASVKKWDYDADGVCSANAGDYTKTDANSMNQTDGTNNGQWICMYGEDTLGNKSNLASANDINVDTSIPYVTNVTSSAANISYKAGVPISIQVVFDQSVTVNTAGGIPTLALNSGGTAAYSSGSPGTTLTFTYTVGAGENSSDLDYTGTTALVLNGGTIKDSATGVKIADLTLPTPGGAGSLGANKDIIIDNIAPTTTGSITGGTLGANGWYTTNVTFTLVPAPADVASTDYCVDTAGTCIPGTTYAAPITVSAESATDHVRWRSTDNAGNVQATQDSGAIKIDKTAPTISLVVPVSSSSVSDTKVSYTLSEAVETGSITWTQTGGTADGGSPHIQALTGAELNAGAHTAITLTNNPTLVDGAIYSVAFNAADYAGLTATTVTSTLVTFSVAAPPAGVACNDGLDNDGDGLIDFPNDDGCTSLSDTSETLDVNELPPGGGGAANASIITSITGNQSYGQAVQIANSNVTTDTENNTKSAQITNEGILTIKPNLRATILLVIPPRTTVEGSLNWDNRIEPPAIVSANLVGTKGAPITGTKDTLKSTQVTILVNVGNESSILNFSHNVQIIIPVRLPEGTEVKIYSSANGKTWNVERSAVVHDDRVVITTNHLTYYAVVNTGKITEELKPAAEVSLKDIVGHWAEPYIMQLVAKGIMTGKTNTSFVPEGTVSRQELIRIIDLAFGIKVPDKVRTKLFRDVEAYAPYAPYIKAAIDAKILKASVNTRFRPADPVTRLDALRMILDAAKVKLDSRTSNLGFKDMGPDGFYSRYIAFAIKYGISSGYSDNTFRPDKPVTRAEVAKMIVKAIPLKK